MIIEDEELRMLFRAESDEHIQKLEEGLLRLESNPADIANLEHLFREAHCLKGAAGMLGVSEVEKVAHRFEDALGAAKRQEEPVTAGSIGRMCSALDALRLLVTQAVTGEPSGVDADQVIAQLDGHDPPSTVGVPAETRISQKPASAIYKIDTIRVEPQKLDALMMQTSELMVMKTRLSHRAIQAERIVEMCEEWSRSRRHDRPEEFSSLLYQLADDIREDGARLEFCSTRLEESVRAVRLLPLSTIFNMFPRVVRDIAIDQQKEVQIVIDGDRIAVDKRILEEIKDPLMHLIRNAVDHGIELPSERRSRAKAPIGTIRIVAVQKGSRIVLEITDDGQGLSLDAIKATARKRGVASQEELDRMTIKDIQALIFMPGFSTSAVVTDISGRGIGMDVVRTSIERLKGSISFESVPGQGCTFRIQLPATLATSHILLVVLKSEYYALPMEYIHSTRLVAAEDIFTLEGRGTILIDGLPVAIVPLIDILELRTVGSQPPSGVGKLLSCVVVEIGQERLALIVDELLDEQEVVVRPLGCLLKRVRNVSGAAILVSGSVCTVLNPTELIESARSKVFEVASRVDAVKEQVKEIILLVEDSITTRTWEKRGLEAAGYTVVTAVDGLDALEKLNEQSFDGIVSDVQMPRMDGLALTSRIRQNTKFKEIPIVLVTSLADKADRKRGIDAGANAYIPKQTFNSKLLIETLKRVM